MSETKLMDCPFCGSSDIDAAFAKWGDGAVSPGCMICGATAETQEGWNTRAATSLHHELVSALEQARKRIAYLGMVAAGRHQEANEATVLPKIDAVLHKAKPLNLDEPRG